MEHVLAFLIVIYGGENRIELAPKHRFSSYEQCERFVNSDKSRNVILEKYTGFGYDRVIPACKQINRATAMKIQSLGGI